MDRSRPLRPRRRSQLRVRVTPLAIAIALMLAPAAAAWVLVPAPGAPQQQRELQQLRRQSISGRTGPARWQQHRGGGRDRSMVTVMATQGTYVARSSIFNLDEDTDVDRSCLILVDISFGWAKTCTHPPYTFEQARACASHRTAPASCGTWSPPSDACCWTASRGR